MRRKHPVCYRVDTTHAHTVANGRRRTLSPGICGSTIVRELPVGNTGTHLNLYYSRKPTQTNTQQEKGSAAAGMHTVILSLKYIHIYCPITGKRIATARRRRWKDNTRRTIGMVRLRQSNAGSVYGRERLGNRATWNMEDANRTRQITMGPAQLQFGQSKHWDPERPRGGR